MARPRMRPRFEMKLPIEGAEWLNALRRVLDDDAGLCRGRIFRQHAVIEIRESARSFWSPVLSIDVSEQPSGTTLSGRFSPHPHVWTLFMAIYMLLGIGALAGIVYGFVQYTLGEPPWAVAAVPVAVALFGFVYGAAFIGQGLSADEMYAMRSIVDRAASQPQLQARSAGADRTPPGSVSD
ncbi:MAG: hypothetical protein AAF436_13945 [Myxococcota bacterium]